MMPSRLNKAKFNSISERRADFTGNVYNPAVLVGNWYEERCSDKSDPKAITPGIYGKSGCINGITTYSQDFINLIAPESHLNTRSFVDWKQQGFSNRLNGENTNIKLWDSDDFANNFTTMNDIMYHILPKEKNNVIDLKRRGNPDLLRSFGYNTKTGLLHWRGCKKFLELNTPIDVSHYKLNFKPVRVKHKVCPVKELKVTTNIFK